MLPSQAPTDGVGVLLSEDVLPDELLFDDGRLFDEGLEDELSVGLPSELFELTEEEYSDEVGVLTEAALLLDEAASFSRNELPAAVLLSDEALSLSDEPLVIELTQESSTPRLLSADESAVVAAELFSLLCGVFLQAATTETNKSTKIKAIYLFINALLLYN